MAMAFTQTELIAAAEQGTQRKPGSAADPSIFAVEAWPEGEVRHERDLFREQHSKQHKPEAPNDGDRQILHRLDKKQLAEKRELARQLGYPDYDPNFDDPEWLKEQFRKESEDPRENPNFFLDPRKDPEFWANAARKPYAKALLRHEAHRDSRRQQWLRQFEKIEDLNKSRSEVAELLQDCSGELKRLIAPVMKYKVVDMFLGSVAQHARESGMGFEELLEEQDTKTVLLWMRQQLDERGEKAAAEMLDEFDCNFNRILDAEQKKADKEPGTATPDAKTLTDALNAGARFKKDGLVEWEKSNFHEALLSWREGCEALHNLKASQEFRHSHAGLSELHGALLRNRAQAAIKLMYWNEALAAANEALQISDQDHKAWFRKACALEGLGQIDGVEDCLNRIEDIAVGRPDRNRLLKDTEAKRTKIEAIRGREQAENKRMLQRGLQKGLFSQERDESAAQPVAAPPGPPAISSSVRALPRVDGNTRKKLTKDGAEELLENLREAYSDRSFQQQVKKLAHDVQQDKAEFVCYLSKVALPVQKPILERWGFDASEIGISEMTRAIQDHTRGKSADLRLRAKAEQALRALYGPMWAIMRSPVLTPADHEHLKALDEEDKATKAGGRRRRRGDSPDGGSHSDSGDDRRKKFAP